MKPTDFARSLQKFFHEHLAQLRGCSTNTIKSYRDTFKIFLNFMQEKRSTPPYKITLNMITSDVIGEFQKFLSDVRKNSESTRNQRMAAIHSFVKFLQRDYPDRISQWQRIQAIPRLKCKTGPVEYLTQKETAVLISVIPSDTKKGIRDKAMLLLLYDSGARVQEIADLTVNDLRLDAPSQVTLTGKGRKTRVVPLMPITVETLREYLKIFRLFKDGESPLFRNRNGEKLTRFGITYLLKGHANVARKNERSILKNMSPHKLRHSKAMHLLELGCTEVVIQHILGHSDLKTTGIYAQSNINMTRAALEKINKTTQENKVEFSWIEDDDIMAMLDRL